MTTSDLESWLLTVQPEFTVVRDLEDGRYAIVKPLMFHYTIIAGAIGDETGYDDRWCFASRLLAENALKAWNYPAEAEPSGWHRHPPSGRRRENGDPSKEYIAF